MVKNGFKAVITVLIIGFLLTGCGKGIRAVTTAGHTVALKTMSQNMDAGETIGNVYTMVTIAGDSSEIADAMVSEDSYFAEEKFSPHQNDKRIKNIFNFDPLKVDIRKLNFQGLSPKQINAIKRLISGEVSIMDFPLEADLSPRELLAVGLFD